MYVCAAATSAEEAREGETSADENVVSVEPEIVIDHLSDVVRCCPYLSLIWFCIVDMYFWHYLFESVCCCVSWNESVCVMQNTESDVVDTDKL